MKILLIFGCAALDLAVCAFGQSQSSSNLPDLAPAAVRADAAVDQQSHLQNSIDPIINSNVNPSSASRDSDDEQQGSALTIKKNVNEVNVVFTVTDGHGHFVKDLAENNFRVLDDNKPQQILSFRSETDLPLRVGLLIDVSDSIRERFRFEQEAAVEFLSQTIRQKTDKAFVVGFNAVAELTQDYTDDAGELARGVRALRPGGSTALFDTIYYTCRKKLMDPLANLEDNRRAIILLSDGDDNQSRFTLGEAIEMAQRAKVIIYAISTNTTGQKTRGDKILEEFAGTTGGRLFRPNKLQEVTRAFADIQSELRSQYAISYHPSDFVPDGRYRRIDIDAKAREKLKVRARKGYYAPQAIAATSQNESPASIEK